MSFHTNGMLGTIESSVGLGKSESEAVMGLDALSGKALSHARMRDWNARTRCALQGNLLCERAPLETEEFDDEVRHIGVRSWPRTTCLRLWLPTSMTILSNSMEGARQAVYRRRSPLACPIAP